MEVPSESFIELLGFKNLLSLANHKSKLDFAVPLKPTRWKALQKMETLTWLSRAGC